MSETVTILRTCDGCGTDLHPELSEHWVLSYQGVRPVSRDTSDKHLCLDCGPHQKVPAGTLAEGVRP